ncbi:spore germination protein [Virgibacillus halophilus]|uniref:Spore germination protein n=1 Tax=Tigheibacillus halophilus TaxID=361280 RepID=A0ABU5C958_9BACI|nr:spore germination protein [Virgibacillus halophilus]
MVVIIALNAVASFSIPEYSLGISFRIILLGFMIAAGGSWALWHHSRLYHGKYPYC